MTLTEYVEIEDMGPEEIETSLLKAVYHWHQMAGSFSPNYLRLMTRPEKTAACLQLLGLIDTLNALLDRAEDLYAGNNSTE